VNSDHLSEHSLLIPPVIAISVWIPVIAISVWIVIVIVILIIGRVSRIVVMGIAIWIIGLPLIAIIGKRIEPTPNAARIIVGRVSTAKDPTRRKPERFLIMIRFC
jgi:hypothetical protein